MPGEMIHLGPPLPTQPAPGTPAAQAATDWQASFAQNGCPPPPASPHALPGPGQRDWLPPRMSLSAEPVHLGLNRAIVAGDILPFCWSLPCDKPNLTGPWLDKLGPQGLEALQQVMVVRVGVKSSPGSQSLVVKVQWGFKGEDIWMWWECEDLLSRPRVLPDAVQMGLVALCARWRGGGRAPPGRREWLELLEVLNY